MIRSRQLYFSLFWIAAALLFNVFIYLYQGQEQALLFLTSYLVEKSLSIDNLLFFLFLFLQFKVPTSSQIRVLFWGVLGAIFFRIILITTGLLALQWLHSLFYLLGGFLLYSGIKLFLEKPKRKNPIENRLFAFCKRFLPVKDAYVENQFFTMQQGKWKVTRLFLVLILIESTDLLFAIDSIPAVFAITRDPFLVITSNLFAILGLRSLYFVLSPLLHKLIYLKQGLACILLFVGTKMVLSDLISLSSSLSLLVICAILLLTCLFSLTARK